MSFNNFIIQWLYAEVLTQQRPGGVGGGLKKGDIDGKGVVEGEVLDEGGLDARHLGIVLVDGAALVFGQGAGMAYAPQGGRHDEEPEHRKEIFGVFHTERNRSCCMWLATSARLPASASMV